MPVIGEKIDDGLFQNSAYLKVMCLQMAVLLTGWINEQQLARNLIGDFSGFLRKKRFLIHDRDPLFTRRFRELLQGAGVTSVRLPPRSPNLNAFAERFVLSIKSECLSRLVILGERVVSEYSAAP